jgi:hypothetical protein
MRVRWLFCFLLLPFVAQTALSQVPVDKKVDCDKGESITAAIGNLNVDKSYVIHVSGVCNENVAINDYEGIALTILGDPSATVQGLAAAPEGPPVFSVANSRRVTLENLTILTSGGLTPTDNPAGVAMNFCRNCEISNSVINTMRSGINLMDSQTAIEGVTINSSATASSAVTVFGKSNAGIRNLTAHGGGGGTGLFVDQGSRVRLGSIPPTAPSIHNYSFGVMIQNGAIVEAAAQCNPSGCLEIHDNLIAGIQIVSAQATFRGVNLTHNKQGILVTNSGTLSFAGPGSVTTSSGVADGVGILVSHNSHAAIVGTSLPSGTNITGNVGRGVAVASNSSVQFVGASGPITVTGNNGAFNIACDGSSLITGTGGLVLPTTISCADQQVAPLVIP